MQQLRINYWYKFLLVHLAIAEILFVEDKIFLWGMLINVLNYFTTLCEQRNLFYTLRIFIENSRVQNQGLNRPYLFNLKKIFIRYSL